MQLVPLIVLEGGLLKDDNYVDVGRANDTDDSFMVVSGQIYNSPTTFSLKTTKSKM